MGVGAIPWISDGDPGAGGRAGRRRGHNLDNMSVGTAALVALGLAVIAARPLGLPGGADPRGIVLASGACAPALRGVARLSAESIR